MEHYTKKKRIYLTSKSYLKKVKVTGVTFLGIAALASLGIIIGLGITFLSLGLIGGIGLSSLLTVRFFWNKARSVSLKSGNLILKSMSGKNVVAPMESIREVKSRPFLGLQLTYIRYRIDGGGAKFFIFTKSNAFTPEQIIKSEIAESRRRKKEANRKPDSVLTQIA